MMNRLTKVWILEYEDRHGESRGTVGVFDSEKLAHDEAEHLEGKYEELNFYVDEYIINEGWDDE